MDLSCILTEKQRAAGLTLRQVGASAILAQDRHIVKVIYPVSNLRDLKMLADYWAARKAQK